MRKKYVVNLNQTAQFLIGLLLLSLSVASCSDKQSEQDVINSKQVGTNNSSTIVGRESLGQLYATIGQELQQILERMPVGDEPSYGFLERTEFKRATLGIPYQEYSIKTYEPTGYWRVPVMVNGENRALVRYIMEDGVWKWKGFGAAGLAQELGQKEKAQTNTPLSGKILRDYDFTCDYLQFDIVSKDTIDGKMIPLESVNSFMKKHFGTEAESNYGVSDIQEIRAKLKHLWKEESH